MSESPQVRVSPDGRIAQRLAEEFDSGINFEVRSRVWLITWTTDTDTFYTRLTDDEEVADWTPLVDPTVLAADWDSMAKLHYGGSERHETLAECAAALRVLARGGRQ